MEHILERRQKSVFKDVPNVGLSERYTSLLGREISPHVPRDSRIATLDELVQKYSDNLELRSTIMLYCNSVNPYDGWILARKGQGYCPEGAYWYYRIGNETLEHVSRKMIRGTIAKDRLAVFRKDSGHVCVRFGDANCPSGNKLYIVRAAYVQLNSDILNEGIKSAKR